MPSSHGDERAGVEIALWLAATGGCKIGLRWGVEWSLKRGCSTTFVGHFAMARSLIELPIPVLDEP
eukprot:5454610-Pleurochrysis_carterae.AAC.6